MIDIRPVAFVIGIMLSALGAAMVLPALAELAVGGNFWASLLGSAALTAFVGATVIVGLDRAPPGLPLWRSLLPFIGGMQLFRLESTDKSDKVMPRATQIATGILITYALLAGLCALLYGRQLQHAVRDGAFKVASVLTTPGFATDNWVLWGTFPTILFLLMIFVGGCSGSTTGGIKSFRFQVLFALGRVQMRRALQPSGVFIAKYNGKPINEVVAQSVLAFVTLYVFPICATAAALGICGVDVVTVLSGAAATVSNVGPGLGDVIGPARSYAPLPDSAKWVLSAAMLRGRLELITVPVLFMHRFWCD